MKLVLAIINDDDFDAVMELIKNKGYMATKLASTGGFLHTGNTTLIIGVDDNQVEEVYSIFEQTCKTRTQTIVDDTPYAGMEGYMRFPIKVKVGGATVFILDVEQFKKF